MPKILKYPVALRYLGDAQSYDDEPAKKDAHNRWKTAGKQLVVLFTDVTTGTIIRTKGIGEEVGTESKNWAPAHGANWVPFRGKSDILKKKEAPVAAPAPAPYVVVAASELEAAKALIRELVERRTDGLGFYYVNKCVGGLGSELSRKIENVLK